MSMDNYQFDFHGEYGSCSCKPEHGERIDLGRHSIEESLGIMEYMATASATAYPVRLDVIMGRVQSYNEAMYKVRPFRESALQMNETTKLFALAKTSPLYTSGVLHKRTQSLDPEIINSISDIVFDSLYKDCPINVSSGWHLRLHCVLKSCDDPCHIYRSPLMEEKGSEYAGRNHRNPGDYGSSEEREADGDGRDDTPDSSWWERDHESDLINDRRSDRRADPDFMERAKEDMEHNCTQREWDDAVEEDHDAVVYEYRSAHAEIKEVQHILREDFGVDMMFVNASTEDEDDSSYRFVPMVWLHTPVKAWDIVANGVKMKKTKKRKNSSLDEDEVEYGEEPELDASGNATLKAWYESEHDDDGFAYYGYAATEVEVSSTTDEVQGADNGNLAAKKKLEKAIEKLCLWPWLHPMQYMPKSAAFPSRRTGAGENLTEQAEKLSKEAWPREVVLRCQLSEEEKAEWDGFVFRD